ncbi:RING finger protein 212B isoform X2 [Struthio camelus]|uniref:RING finger protein 212B isoform X2 n=1 Tax=Struthio camelus TaxID=8801 RepID=UPI003603F169
MSAPGTDWFHCNRCFRQEGAQFSVTSCGHVLCRQCAGAGKCPVCGAACKSLRLSDEMRPQEKLFFESPAAVALKRLARVSQAWRFQRAQTDLLLAFREDEARRARAALQETRQALAARHRELEALRRENGELRQHLRALQDRHAPARGRHLPGADSHAAAPAAAQRPGGEPLLLAGLPPPALAGWHRPLGVRHPPALQRCPVSSLGPQPDPQGLRLGLAAAPVGPPGRGAAPRHPPAPSSHPPGPRRSPAPAAALRHWLSAVGRAPAAAVLPGNTLRHRCVTPSTNMALPPSFPPRRRFVMPSTGACAAICRRRMLRGGLPAPKMAAAPS